MSENKKILVVEDNDFVRTQIATFLKGAGYLVEEAIDGQAAETQMVSQPNMIIADVMMEPVGGFTFIRNLRNNGNETPVIFVTGDQKSDLLEQSNKLGGVGVLIKPVQKDRLLMMVERTLKKVG